MKESSTNGQVTFSQTQLDEAFNHFTDIMDRCLCPFILLGETARSIIQDEKLEGEAIFAGVRKAEFTDNTWSMLRTLSSNIDIRLGMEGFKKTDGYFSWSFKDIPIKVKIIHRKYGFINNPTFAWYYAENYKVPNPFKNYWRIRYLIK